MKIIVLCAGGMSTSLLVKSMANTEEARNLNIIIQAGSVSELGKLVETCDIIMVAPQIRHRLGEIKEKGDKFGKVTIVIEPQVYGMIDGKGAIKQVLSSLEQK